MFLYHRRGGPPLNGKFHNRKRKEMFPNKGHIIEKLIRGIDRQKCQRERITVKRCNITLAWSLKERTWNEEMETQRMSQGWGDQPKADELGSSKDLSRQTRVSYQHGSDLSQRQKYVCVFYVYFLCFYGCVSLSVIWCVCCVIQCLGTRSWLWWQMMTHLPSHQSPVWQHPHWAPPPLHTRTHTHTHPHRPTSLSSTKSPRFWWSQALRFQWWN